MSGANHPTPDPNTCDHGVPLHEECDRCWHDHRVRVDSRTSKKMTLVESLRMEAATSQQVEASDAGSPLWREGLGLIGRKMAAAADEIERLTRELAQAKAGFASLNGAHEALRQRFAKACAEITRLSGEPGSAHETTASPQAPIARITVKADRCYAVELYAPGLPPGEHDLYCEPEAVAPMREKRAYYETHDPPHCPTCECGMPSEMASETVHEGATPLAKIADKLDTAEDLTDCERGCAADALRTMADADVRHVRLRQYRMPARELPDDDEPSEKASEKCPHDRPLGTPCPRCDL